MTSYAVRFFVAGALACVVPLIAATCGARLAGVLALAPVLTAVSLLGVPRGEDQLGTAMAGALHALPALAVFLLAARAFGAVAFPVVAVGGAIVVWSLAAYATITAPAWGSAIITVVGAVAAAPALLRYCLAVLAAAFGPVAGGVLTASGHSGLPAALISVTGWVGLLQAELRPANGSEPASRQRVEVGLA